MNTLDRSSLRRHILAQRDSLSEAVLVERSQAIAQKILSLPAVAESAVILVYMHFRSEVRTGHLINELLALGKSVCIPLTLPDQSQLLVVRINDPSLDTAPGYCSIPEPLPDVVSRGTVPPGDIDAVIVPGAVFDREGGRLGYGGGYYDRFLSKSARNAVRIAPAFELQVVERVPLEPHDQQVDVVVTETTISRTGRSRHA